MIEVRQSAEFSDWLRRLRDADAAARIVGRIRRLEMGNPGDTKNVGDGILEMRIDYGPGCRIYHVRRGTRIVVCSVAATSARNSTTSSEPGSWRRLCECLD